MSMSTHELEVFFDGECPLCKREIDWLRQRDRSGRVLFTDLAGSGFDAASVGKTHDELMARIHGRHPDGTWLEGVDLFVLLYDLTRLKWLSNLMANRFLRPLNEAGYRFFAKHRLSLTGRKRCDDGCRLEPKAG